MNISTQPTTVDMRIVSDGTTLRAYYRFEGGPWTPYGEPAALASVPNPKVGIYANDSNATVTSRDDAVFDYFRIDAGLPDTTRADLGGDACRRHVHGPGRGHADGRRRGLGRGPARVPPRRRRVDHCTAGRSRSPATARTRSSTGRPTSPATWAPCSPRPTRSRAAAARPSSRASPTRRPARLRCDVSFTATGLDPDGGAPLSYRWTLGDGTVLGPEFEWTFTDAGRSTRRP